MITPWVAMNIASTLLAAFFTAVIPAAYHDALSRIERATLVLLSAALVLRIGPMIAKNVLEATSPYDNWSVAMLHGALISAAICVLRRFDDSNRAGTLRVEE